MALYLLIVIKGYISIIFDYPNVYIPIGVSHVGDNLKTQTSKKSETVSEKSGIRTKAKNEINTRFCVYGDGKTQICYGLYCDQPCAHGLQISQEDYEILKAYRDHILFNETEITHAYLKDFTRLSKDSEVIE